MVKNTNGTHVNKHRHEIAMKLFKDVIKYFIQYLKNKINDYQHLIVVIGFMVSFRFIKVLFACICVCILIYLNVCLCIYVFMK